MKKLLLTAAAMLVSASAAYAYGEDYPPISSRGTAGVVIGSTALPYIMPFVSDRTAHRYRPHSNWQPGPFRDVEKAPRAER